MDWLNRIFPFYNGIFGMFEEGTGDAGAGGTEDAGAGDAGSGDAGEGGEGGAEDFKALYAESQEKLKAFDGFDSDRYNKVKDIDLEAYESDRGLVEVLTKNKDLWDHLTNVTKGLKDGKQFSELVGPGTPAKAPEGAGDRKPKDFRDSRVDDLLARQEAQDSESALADFDNAFDTSINAKLKGMEGFEFLNSESEKGKSFFDEKQYVKEFVSQSFIDDYDQAERTRSNPKMTLKDVPALVDKALNALNGYRNLILAKGVKTDESPEHFGSGSGGQNIIKKEDLAGETKAERVVRITKDFNKSSHFAGTAV